MRTLYGVGELDMDDVQAVGLGPEKFARRLRRHVPDARRELSADAAWFHDRLVDTTSVHVLHFFTQRSTFVARTAVEQSRRNEAVVRLLERHPSPAGADARFETGYLASLVQLLHGVLELLDPPEQFVHPAGGKRSGELDRGPVTDRHVL